MHHEHSTIREGLIAGLLGGLLALGWYVVFDAVRGEPFQTPNALGQVFAARPQGGGVPAAGQIQTVSVVGYLILHFVVFCLLGIALAKFTHLAMDNPALRMGVWLGAAAIAIGVVLLLHAFVLFAARGIGTPAPVAHPSAFREASNVDGN